MSANKRAKWYEVRVRRRGRREANGNQNTGVSCLRSITKRVETKDQIGVFCWRLKSHVRAFRSEIARLQNVWYKIQAI